MNKNGSECIKILLHSDHVNVDAKDRSQRTSIMYAIINGIDSNIIGKINRSYSLIDNFFRFVTDEMQTFRCN